VVRVTFGVKVRVRERARIRDKVRRTKKKEDGK
jgi:hypothetical protein